MGEDDWNDDDYYYYYEDDDYYYYYYYYDDDDDYYYYYYEDDDNDVLWSMTCEVWFVVFDCNPDCPIVIGILPSGRLS